MTGSPAPTPDSVRLALATESEVIATVQRRGWADDLPAEVSRAMLAQAGAEQVADLWRTAITRPPVAQCRVLVALEDQQVVGFAATAPADDPDTDPSRDGLVGELVIDPPARRRGHGSRLLNAAVDTLRADGYRRALCWVRATDDVTRAFLVEAGWGPDGSHTELGTDEGEARVTLVRLHTDITAAE